MVSLLFGSMRCATWNMALHPSIAGLKTLWIVEIDSDYFKSKGVLLGTLYHIEIMESIYHVRVCTRYLYKYEKRILG